MDGIMEKNVCELCGRSNENISCGTHHNVTLVSCKSHNIDMDLINQKKTHLQNIQRSTSDLKLKNFPFVKMITRVNLELENVFINTFKSLLQTEITIDNILHPFLLPPLNITASAMSKLETFTDTLKRRSINVAYAEIHGEIAHRYFGECFPVDKGLANITASGITLQVNCRADGLWINEITNESYIIEFKTVTKTHTISSKLESWLLQIACYQLAYQSNTLLFILDVGSYPFQTYLYHVSPENISRSIRSTWTHWFRNHACYLKPCLDYQKGKRTLTEILRSPSKQKNKNTANANTSPEKRSVFQFHVDLFSSDDEKEVKGEGKEMGEENNQDQRETAGDDKDKDRDNDLKEPASTSHLINQINSIQLEEELTQLSPTLLLPSSSAAGNSSAPTTATSVTSQNDENEFQIVTTKKKRNQKGRH